MKPKVIFIVGPTGVGKTETGLKVAGLIPCAFISADSMQIYKGMDIVTDKLPVSLRKNHLYHLVDIIEPTEEFSVADFCRRAKRNLRSILKNGKTPLVIGGSGLYVNSLLYGIFKGPGRNVKIRAGLEAEREAKGLTVLYERLKGADPEAAAKINPHDARRIIRALEVYEGKKIPLSVLQKKRRGLTDEYQVLLFGLRRNRKELYRRIDQRVDLLVNAGLLDEVRRLLKKRLSRTAYCAIGVREMEGFLKGAYDFSEAVRLIKRNSRRFAKRQMTWFNKNKDIEWIDVGQEEDLGVIAQKIFERVNC